MRALVRILAIGLATSTVLVGCGPPAPAVPEIVVLVDRSGSARSAEVQTAYLGAFARVTAYAAARAGTVVVETIEANPLQHSGTPVSVDFTLPASVRHNPVYASPLLSQRRATASAALEQVLGTPPGAPGSDLFSAMALATRVFERPGGGSRQRLLIVCSDMLQSTNAYDFYSQPLDDAQSQRIIDELRGSGQLPDLGGVSVWVVGAGRDSVFEIASERNQGIERFFRLYFAAAGARLVTYSSTLAAFPPTGDGA